jgi:uncharacterized membrane protein YfcA
MISGIWVEIVALVAAFAIATVTTPAGVSGAVLLLPFQFSVLGTPSPAVTPTNLLYNVAASPGAIWRYRRQGQTGGALSWLLLAGTLPGVGGGSVIRVYLLPGPVVFDLVVAAVLIPLGALARPDAHRACPGGWRGTGMGELLAEPGKYLGRAPGGPAAAAVCPDPAAWEDTSTVVAGLLEGAPGGGVGRAEALCVVRRRRGCGQLPGRAAGPGTAPDGEG